MLPAIPSLRCWSWPCPVISVFIHLSFAYLVLSVSSLLLPQSGLRARPLCLSALRYSFLPQLPPLEQRVDGDFESRNFQFIKEADKTGENEWKVDLAGFAEWLLSACLSSSLSFKGMAASFLLCLPLSCLSSSPSMICRLWPEKPLAKLWQSRARGYSRLEGLPNELNENKTSTRKTEPNIFCFKHIVMIWVHVPLTKGLHWSKNQYRSGDPEKLADIVHMARGGWQSVKSGPGAGRVTAQPWMTRLTRPEGTDNGQRVS